jgi:hypothetical protein
MKVLIGIVLVLLIAGSLLVDYLWKRWVARQRDYRNRHPDEFRR